MVEKGLMTDVVLPILDEAKDAVVPIAAGYAGGLAGRPKNPPEKQDD